MIVELVAVGTELLLGMIANTNAQYLSKQCSRLGMDLYHHTVVGDNEERIAEAINCALTRSDIIICTGGLGPTKDDITKEAIAKCQGLDLVEDATSRQMIEEYFSKKGIEPTENNWKQALVPQGCQVVINDNGTAPGIIITTKENKKIILLPGPPSEMISMFENKIADYFEKMQETYFYSKMIKICGVGESKVATVIADLIDEQTNPTIAMYAKMGEVSVRVMSKASDRKSAKKIATPVIKEICKRFKSSVFTKTDSVNLEDAVVGLLRENDYTIAIAESCTGGMLASKLVAVPGASKCFEQGYITYANGAKQELLNVKKKTLKTYGAVSKETAKEMAIGAMKAANSDVSVAITGIAGPQGGTEEKAVGLVYISCDIKGECTTKEYNFDGDRTKIREQAVTRALIDVREAVLRYNNEI